mmetsp:Transcript_8602/g.16277  ORF Transcript_8602/g.16277 Transcript_8602/m.16277 type:complete len:184 (+) Transcript_8602:2151-2702(+)
MKLLCLKANIAPMLYKLGCDQITKNSKDFSASFKRPERMPVNNTRLTGLTQKSVLHLRTSGILSQNPKRSAGVEDRDNGMPLSLRPLVSRKHFKANRPFLFVVERKNKIVMMSEIRIAPHPLGHHGARSHKIEDIRDYTWGTSCALADDPLTDEDEDFLEVALERSSKGSYNEDNDENGIENG